MFDELPPPEAERSESFHHDADSASAEESRFSCIFNSR
jgi:hypothetical protein